MTDNYQFDKNSKLFQKFLALKANKNNDSFTQRNLPNQSAALLAPKIEQTPTRVTELISNKSEMLAHLPSNTNRKPQLHVTIDDIEQAASEALNESTRYHEQIERKQIKREEKSPRNEENLRQDQKEHQRASIDSLKQSQVLGFTAKNERIRERRARQFQSKPQVKLETRDERSPKTVQQIQTYSFKRPKVEEHFREKEREVQKEKENIELNTISELPKKTEEHTFTLGSKENEYLKKIEKLNEKLEELKDLLQQERKDKQRIISEKETQIETIKEKYFQLRSNEDTLTTQLKRYKEKVQSENLLRTRFEEEVKQLNFRILELQEMLEGKQSSIKKRTDEISYWKNQTQTIKSQTKQLFSQLQALQQRCQFFQSQNKILQRDISNKQNLIQQVRKNMNILIEQNTIAKDQIYKLTIRLYQIEQMNLSLKGDLQRREKDQSFHINAIQDNYLKSIESFSPKKNRERLDRTDNVAEREQRVTKQANNGRRRQFARERATTKLERNDRNEEQPERQQRNMPQRGQRRQQKVIEPERIQPNKDAPKNNNSRQIAARIEFLQAELQIRSKMKSMTGKMRKEKIDMQRELQHLLSQS